MLTFLINPDLLVKVTSLDGRELHTIDALDSSLHSVVPTPEKYGSMVDDGYGSEFVSLCAGV